MHANVVAQPIKVMVIGAFGKMGALSVTTLQADPVFEVVATVGRHENVHGLLQSHAPDVVLDFTLPDVVYGHAKMIIDYGAHPVIGTSGLDADQITQLQVLAQSKQLGGLIVPNFSIAAVLMMRFAAQAATVLDKVEIVELHHAQKVDAPSGTATKTAALIQAARACPDAKAPCQQMETVDITSVRLPGIFAHQAVVFTGEGEALTIKHDAISREAMMPGVRLACRQVLTLDALHYGLDDVL